MTTVNQTDSSQNVFGRGGLIFKSKAHCQSGDFAIQKLLGMNFKFVSKTDLKPGEVVHGKDGSFRANG